MQRGRKQITSSLNQVLYISCCVHFVSICYVIPDFVSGFLCIRRFGVFFELVFHCDLHSRNEGMKSWVESGQKTSALPPVRDKYSRISKEWISKSDCPMGRIEWKKDVLFYWGLSPKHFGLCKLAWVTRSLVSFHGNLPSFATVFREYLVLLFRWRLGSKLHIWKWQQRLRQQGGITSAHVRDLMARFGANGLGAISNLEKKDDVFKKFPMAPGSWWKGKSTLKTVERNLYTSFLDS